MMQTRDAGGRVTDSLKFIHGSMYGPPKKSRKPHAAAPARDGVAEMVAGKTTRAPFARAVAAGETLSTDPEVRREFGTDSRFNAFHRGQAAGRVKLYGSGGISADRLPLTAADRAFDSYRDVPIETLALAAWRCSPELQTEFLDFNSYVAYRKGAARCLLAGHA